MKPRHSMAAWRRADGQPRNEIKQFALNREIAVDTYVRWPVRMTRRHEDGTEFVVTVAMLGMVRKIHDDGTVTVLTCDEAPALVRIARSELTTTNGGE